VILEQYTCRRCGFEFEHQRTSARGRRRQFCDECITIHRRDYSTAYKAREADPTTVLLPDGHPVLPLLSETVTLRMTVREMFGAARCGDDAGLQDALGRLAQLVNYPTTAYQEAS
jgi:hypothetical protein